VICELSRGKTDRQTDRHTEPITIASVQSVGELVTVEEEETLFAE